MKTEMELFAIIGMLIGLGLIALAMWLDREGY